MQNALPRPPAEKVHDRNQRHFSTDHLLSDLRNRTISSGAITFVAQGCQFALNLASIIVLARLLTPGDFGLVAMVTAIMGFLRVFKDAGLSTATVQREGITHAQVSNLFWINVAISGAVSLVVAAGAPAIASFYREPRLLRIALPLSLTFVLTGSTVQHLALLYRQMRFKAIAAIQVSSMAAGVVVGISMAYLGCGYWSLVGMNLVTPIVALILTWSISHWRPCFPKSNTGTWPLLSFGTNMAAGTFVYSLAQGTDSLLIGRFYGPDAIGLYSRALALLTRPLDQAFATLNTVFVPALSRLQLHPNRYRRAFLQAYESIALIAFPATALCLALAHPLTISILGPKWEKAATIFAAFTIVALYFPLFNVSSWLFATQGRGRDSLIGFLIASVVMVGSFVVGLPFGPAGVALAYSAGGLLIQLPVRYYIAGRRGPVTTTDLWLGFLKYLPLWLVVWGATSLARTLTGGLYPLAQVAVCTPIGLLFGGLLVWVVTPIRVNALNLVSAIQGLWKNRRRNGL